MVDGIGVDEKKDSMRFYDATAPSYEELYGEEQQSKYDAALKAIEAAHLGSVLDVGCGPGIFLRSISAMSILSVGIDTSCQSLKYAKRSGVANLACADADFLPLRDEAFDSVFAFTLVQNMPDPASALREMLRVVRSGGLVVVTMPVGHRSEREVRHWLEKTCASVHDAGVDSSPKDLVLVCLKADGVSTREPKRF